MFLLRKKKNISTVWLKKVSYLELLMITEVICRIFFFFCTNGDCVGTQWSCLSEGVPTMSITR